VGAVAEAGAAAACDFDGDGAPEIVTAPGPGGSPLVRVWRVSPTSAAPLGELASGLAYAPEFTAGVYVACGDVDGDGVPEVVTGAGQGGAAHVRAFRVASGALLPTEISFLAYNPGFTGGVRVAVGTLRGIGPAIVTAAGPGGGPHIQAFVHAPGALGGVVPPGVSFFAYAPAFAAGIYVAVADLDGDGAAEIVTGAGEGGGPHVAVWRAEAGSVALQGGFFAYDLQYTGGVRVAAAAGTIVTSTGPGGGPHIRTFNTSGIATATSFFAY
jgi:serralysin